MKNHQDNANALPALLRAAGGVDTPETNSLCCVAAGIIAPPSATAEALIPHEKLRGAALADATLNAQKRPLAQPVVGYKHAEGLQEEGEGRHFSPVVPTDTQLIEWLDRRGSFWRDLETSQINFPHEETDTEGYKHLRDALVEAYQQDQAELSGGDA